MESRCGIYSTSWRRVALIDMTDPEAQCPSGLLEVSNSTTQQRACGRSVSSGCSSVTFPTEKTILMSAEGCENISTAHRMPSIPLQERQSMMSILVAHQSLMASRGGTFGALQQAIMNSIREIPITFAPAPAQTLTTQIGTFLTLLEMIITVNVDLTYHKNRIAWEDPLWGGTGCVALGNTRCQTYGWFQKQVDPTSDSIEVSGDHGRTFNADVFTDLVKIRTLN